MSTRVLVTGATGFVGSHLAESLLLDGYNVRLLVRDSTRLRWFNPRSFEITVGDLTGEKAIQEAVQSVDIVIHCAGVTKAAKSSEFFRVNEYATRLLARASENAGVKRFVQCSTLAVCGPSSLGSRLRESDAELPITNYGRSKLAGEIAVREELERTEWTIVRPPAVMGPRDEQFVPLFKMMLRWGIYTQVGWSQRLYSLIGVNDLVRVLKLAAFTESASSKTYFAALPNPFEWGDVAYEFSTLYNRRLTRIIVPEFVSRSIGLLGDFSTKMTGKPALLSSEKVREILAHGWVCDVGKINRDIGFCCQDSIKDVLRTTCEFYVKERWI